MNNQLQEDMAEAVPYLEKSSGRKRRLENSKKSKKHSEHRKAREQREYTDGFGGNYN